jgi:hypothetical protein
MAADQQQQQPLWRIVVSLSSFGHQNPSWQKVWKNNRSTTTTASTTTNNNRNNVPYYRIVFLFVLLQSFSIWCQFIIASSSLFLVDFPYLLWPGVTDETRYHQTRTAHRRESKIPWRRLGLGRRGTPASGAVGARLRHSQLYLDC